MPERPKEPIMKRPLFCETIDTVKAATFEVPTSPAVAFRRPSVQILPRVRVAFRTMRLADIHASEGVSTSQCFGPRDLLQMFWIHAALDSAGLADIPRVSDSSPEQLVSDPVCEIPLSLVLRLSIAGGLVDRSALNPAASSAAIGDPGENIVLQRGRHLNITAIFADGVQQCL